MPEYTNNLNLEKPLGNEYYDIDTQNANMEKIDKKFGIGTEEGHAHDGTGGQGKKISYTNLLDKPSSFTPTAHKSTHASGGTDPLTPADIGAIPNTNNAVIDSLIGSRTADQTQVPSTQTGTITQLFSWITNRIKAITGKNNWFDAPDITLANASQHINAVAPHSGHLNKTTNILIDPLQINFGTGAGEWKMVRIPGIVNEFRKIVILLHEIYNGTILSRNYCVGTLFEERGATNNAMINNAYAITTGSAYNSTCGTATSTMQDAAGYKGKLVTCLYNGKKYIALELGYNAMARAGWYFTGYALSTGESLKAIEYYDVQTSTVLNSEINNSLADFTSNINVFSDCKNMYINNNLVWHAGNDGAGSGLDADKFNGHAWSEVFTTMNAGNIPIVYDSSTTASVNNTTTYAVDNLWTVGFPANSLRIQFELSQTQSNTAYARITKNGVAVGTERTRTGSSPVTFTEDIPNWAVGDVLGIQLKNNVATGSAVAGRIKVSVDKAPGLYNYVGW